MADLRKRCRCRSLERFYSRRGKQTRLLAAGSGLPFRKAVCGRAGEPVVRFRHRDLRSEEDHRQCSREPRSDVGGDKIFFNSDRDGHFNLYAYDTKSAKTSQITTNKDWDVRWPSTDKHDRIVFELNGELQILNVKNGKATPISVTVPDDGVNRRPSRVSAVRWSNRRA